MCISRITDAFVRTYADTGQKVAFVNWIDSDGKKGATHGAAEPLGVHMQALFDRATREGVTIRQDLW